MDTQGKLGMLEKLSLISGAREAADPDTRALLAEARDTEAHGEPTPLREAPMDGDSSQMAEAGHEVSRAAHEGGSGGGPREDGTARATETTGEARQSGERSTGQARSARPPAARPGRDMGRFARPIAAGFEADDDDDDDDRSMCARLRSLVRAARPYLEAKAVEGDVEAAAWLGEARKLT